MFFIYLLRKPIPQVQSTEIVSAALIPDVCVSIGCMVAEITAIQLETTLARADHTSPDNEFIFKWKHLHLQLFKVSARALELNKVTLAGLNQLPLSDSQHIKSEISPICSPEAGTHPGQVISPSQDTLLPPTLTNTTLQINFMCLCLNWGREVPGENPHWTTHRKAQTGIKQWFVLLPHSKTG